MTLEAEGARQKNFLDPAHAECVFLREVISTVVDVRLVSVSGSITELKNTSIAQCYMGCVPVW